MLRYELQRVIVGLGGSFEVLCRHEYIASCIGETRPARPPAVRVLELLVRAVQITLKDGVEPDVIRDLLKPRIGIEQLFQRRKPERRTSRDSVANKGCVPRSWH